MKTEDGWTYYTPQEAADILVTKHADDQFSTRGEGNEWTRFGGDALSATYKYYSYEVTAGVLKRKDHCIRRRGAPPSNDEDHFI